MTTRQLYELLKAEIGKLEAENAEMLAALKAINSATFAPNSLTLRVALDAVRAAIAKADGNCRKRK